MQGWKIFEAEAQSAFVGEGRFPLRAYSEYMPPPWVGMKPYDPRLEVDSATAGVTAEDVLDITEYELTQELDPGLDRIAATLAAEIAKLARGAPHRLSHTLLDGNPAWTPALAEAAARHGFRNETVSLALALCLSRTQDDKGNVRWTLFGASHAGPARAFWSSFDDDDGVRFGKTAGWLMEGSEAPQGKLAVLADPAELPAFARPLVLTERAPLTGVGTIVTFRAFAQLPEAVQKAYLERKILLVPSPGSLVFFYHPGYARLARDLPRARQIPLLHLFPRIEGACAIRIPQSGWLDEHAIGRESLAGGHRIVSSVARTHRWQRVERDQAVAPETHFEDDVSVALFSTDPDDLGLYGKPMARNAQVWTEEYALLLDGPGAGRPEIEHAEQVIAKGGRYGYRFYFPPMRAGIRELYWHLPLVARLEPKARQAVRAPELLTGCVTAERAGAPKPGEDAVVLRPRMLERPGHKEAATLFPRDPGLVRNTSSYNIRKLLEFAAMLGRSFSATFARALVQCPKHCALEDWLARLRETAAHPHEVGALLEQLRSLAAAPAGEAGDGGLTFASTATRDFEERYWRTIASLAEGEFLHKENADAIPDNKGKTGGPAARRAHVAAAERRDLDRLAEHLHAGHNATIARHGMTGRADVVDHVFRWETDFSFPWSKGWEKSQGGKACERNVVMRIPGKNRGEAVVFADHYDTAYMEDVYEKDRGGDGLRAAARGADDNHSATAALLLAADVFLPLAREGKLARDVWLVHLTGEEFPSDCMGARALAQALVERSLAFARETGEREDVSKVRVTGVYVADMIAHNNQRDRDTFLICPGEGAESARLALFAHRANEAWNREAAARNGSPERAGKGRAERMPDGSHVPPPFAHLPVAGQVAAEWEPRSVLYNTDGQIFSDVGVPVVLFMENYDINRTGYHDTHDTMENIDLDYGSAVAAIAIEAVARAATEPDAHGGGKR